MEKSISFSALEVRIEIHLVSYICNSSIVPMPFQIFLAFHLALVVGRVFLSSCSKFFIE